MSRRFVALILGATGGAATAQSKPVTFIGAVDFPTVYFFRGIRQEADPKFTTFLAGDLGISLLSNGSGSVKSAGINVGTWNALLTGSSGSGGPLDNPFYESDLYAGLTLGLGGNISLTPLFTAYTSPNDAFKTVKEISFKVAQASRVAPYALVAFELGGDDSGQADAGDQQGTYLELGIGPSWPIGGGNATVAVPVKLGLSLNNYYENPATGEDTTFGYIVGGVLFTVPFGGGKWNVHGGVDVYGLGDATKFFNNGDAGQVIGSVGIGMTF